MMGGPGAAAFFLYKAVWFLIMPTTLATLLLLIAFFTSWKRPIFSRCFLLLGLLIFFGLGSGDVAQRLAGPLERVFPSPPATASAEAVVVLGGGVDLLRSAANRVEFNEASERIIEGVKLLKEGRAKILIVSGGSGDPLQQKIDEATFLAAFAKSFGIDPSAIIVQKKSRTTQEDAKYTAQILRWRKIESFFLATSATHMPRAVGCFKKEGFKPIPYPVDYRAHPRHSSFFSYLPSADGLKLSTDAVHEHLGYAVYWFLDYL